MSFEPNNTVLAFFAMQRFGYFALIVLLVLPRIALGRGPARWPAIGAFLVAAAGLGTAFAPALGLNSGTLYVTMAQSMARLDGMALTILSSALFLLSWGFPERRWKVLDVLHLIAVAGMIGLWWWVMG